MKRARAPSDTRPLRTKRTRRASPNGHWHLLIDDVIGVIAGFLVAPADYYALARVNKNLRKLLLSDFDVHERMKRLYFVPWKRVLLNPLALESEPLQTRELCLAAVRRDGEALEFVREQTTEICLAAVKQRAWALEHVKEQTPEICRAAVRQNGYTLKYVKEQSTELCLLAVRRNGLALGYVNLQTPEICLAAVLQDVRARVFIASVKLLNYVIEHTPALRALSKARRRMSL